MKFDIIFLLNILKPNMFFIHHIEAYDHTFFFIIEKVVGRSLISSGLPLILKKEYIFSLFSSTRFDINFCMYWNSTF